MQSDRSAEFAVPARSRSSTATERIQFADPGVDHNEPSANSIELLSTTEKISLRRDFRLGFALTYWFKRRQVDGQQSARILRSEGTSRHSQALFQR